MFCEKLIMKYHFESDYIYKIKQAEKQMLQELCGLKSVIQPVIYGLQLKSSAITNRICAISIAHCTIFMCDLWQNTIINIRTA